MKIGRKFGFILGYCNCGCKLEIPIRSQNRGELRLYAVGHANKGKSNYWSIKSEVKERTSRERALKILIALGRTKCDIDNKDCLGILEVHHIDKNPLNNNIINLAMLCHSHHCLCDRRNISVVRLRNIELIYTIKPSGMRKYK